MGVLICVDLHFKLPDLVCNGKRNKRDHESRIYFFKFGLIIIFTSLLKNHFHFFAEKVIVFFQMTGYNPCRGCISALSERLISERFAAHECECNGRGQVDCPRSL